MVTKKEKVGHKCELNKMDEYVVSYEEHHGAILTSNWEECLLMHLKVTLSVTTYVFFCYLELILSLDAILPLLNYVHNFIKLSQF